MNAASPRTDRSIRRQARAEAAAWIARLHGPQRTPDVEAAFRHWLGASEENRLQFERVTQVWDDARGVPLGHSMRPARRSRFQATRVWAFAAVILMALGICTLSAYRIWWAGTYHTGVGEQLLVHLEDGSRVLLNSDTKIRVQFARDRRHIIMSHGEAFFEVAHVPDRSFVVSVGAHDVTALGTAFQVRYDAGSTAVTLIEGKVVVSNASHDLPDTPSQDVSRRDTSAQAPRARSRRSVQAVTLTPGERLLMVRDAAPRLDSPSVEVVTAWRRGEVVLDKTTLNDAIAEMNRYQDKQLVIGAPSIGNLRISGIYHVGDGKGFAQTIAKLYGLQVTEQDNQIRLSAGQSADSAPHP